MKKLKLIMSYVLLAGFILPASLFADTVTEEWVARYIGPGNFYDTAYAIAVDTVGNVYVTGLSYGSRTYYDYVTIKYDANGNELWVKRYNGPENRYDAANAIAVDTLGNVYVTGTSYGSGTSYDYATIKYDANGNELWVKRYNDPGYSFDRAYAIAVDTLGNVYVTGESSIYLSGTSYDYATIKYDANGNELWVKRYNGPGNSDDNAYTIALDTLDNVYVTGRSVGSGTYYDYATVKYAPNGNELWVARYNDPRNSYDAANAIALDELGNIYVTGQSYLSDTAYDYATIKYDANGNELWVKRYNGAGNSHDNARAIAVDTLGNVYVTGESIDSGPYYDYATIKYDTNGNELWVARYNAPGNLHDLANAIALDTLGNIYVTGQSYLSDTAYDYATIKYDTNGNELWVARYNGPGNFYDIAYAIAVDTLGNVYVTGQSYGSGGDGDYATMKYSQVPSELVADDISTSTAEDTPTNITLVATDPQNDPLTYYIVSHPSNGSVTLNENIATYTPDANFYGTDSFTYKANDGVDDSNIATVTITVNSVNDAPVAIAGQNQETLIAKPVEFNASASYDIDGTIATYTWDFGDGSTAQGVTTSHTYNTAGNFTVTLTVTDNEAATGTATLLVTVKTPSQSINDVITVIETFNLQQGIENNLDAKLDNVLAALEAANAGQREDALNKMQAFINAVEAQRGKQLTNEQADTLINMANDIINAINS